MPYSLPQACRCFALFFAVALAGCAPLNKYSFETFRPNPAHFNYGAEGSGRSDLLALVYADYVAKLLEGRSTGARLTREISDSTLAVGGAVAAAQETLGIAAETIAKMGVGIVIIKELQGIFNARGRSEAFADAAYLVRQAQAEYRAFNPNPSPEYMTENGATLVRRVDSAVHAARKTLIGRMPVLLDLQQATQPMSEKGAKKTSAGPTNFLATATGDVPLPARSTQADVEGAVDAALAKFEKRQARTVKTQVVRPLTPTDFMLKVETFTQQLMGMRTAEQLGPVYKALFGEEPLTDPDAMRQAVNDHIMAVRNLQPEGDGTMGPAARDQLAALNKAFGR